MDPSAYSKQLERVPGGSMGVMSQSYQPQAPGGTDHMTNVEAGRDQIRMPTAQRGQAEPELRAQTLGHIPRTQNVGGDDHCSAPSFSHDALRNPNRGAVEPWLRKEMLPQMGGRGIEYEGSTAADVGGRDHFGAGGEGGNWLAANYEPNGDKLSLKGPLANDRPNSPSARFARGEKVTPFHERRSIPGKSRESWDTLKHLPGHANTRQGFMEVGGCGQRQTLFHTGFQRRRQSDINQDGERKQTTEWKDHRVANQNVVRKEFIRTNVNKNTFNPITGEYTGKAHNPAFQEMITCADGAQYTDRYRHHVKRALPGPGVGGECSDCKPVHVIRREASVREGCSVAKHKTRGCVKDLFMQHDGYQMSYEKSMVAALPKLPKPKVVMKISNQCT